MVDLFVNIFYIILGICGIGFVIGFHEFGHLLFAKLFDIKAPTFSIGMGPQIWKKKIGETTYTLSAIPLGGYVEIAGEDNEEPATAAEKKRFFNHKPYYQQLCVMFGGILFNLILGIVFMSFLFMVGMPKTQLLNPECIRSEVHEVKDGYPGATAGFQTGDLIVAGKSADGQAEFDNALEVMRFLGAHRGESIKLQVKRDGRSQWLNTDLDKRGQLGVVFTPCTGNFEPESFISSIKSGFDATWEMFVNTYKAFASIITRKAQGAIGGPLMIIRQIMTGAKEGFRLYLFILAFISINLAFLNLIPVPIMDGGQIVLHTIQAIMGRPLPERIRDAIGITCWVAVIALFILLTLNDILMMANTSLGTIASKFTR